MLGARRKPGPVCLSELLCHTIFLCPHSSPAGPGHASPLSVPAPPATAPAFPTLQGPARVALSWLPPWPPFGRYSSIPPGTMALPGSVRVLIVSTLCLVGSRFSPSLLLDCKLSGLDFISASPTTTGAAPAQGGHLLRCASASGWRWAPSVPHSSLS